MSRAKAKEDLDNMLKDIGLPALIMLIEEKAKKDAKREERERVIKIINMPCDWLEYSCGSAGHVSQEAVKRYINEQEGKDVFEYNVFGSPNQKIGNFTGQKKLGDFSC